MLKAMFCFTDRAGVGPVYLLFGQIFFLLSEIFLSLSSVLIQMWSYDNDDVVIFDCFNLQAVLWGVSLDLEANDG